MATTDSQKRAVLFCVMTLRVPFRGNLDNFDDVHEFLDNHLERAKLIRKQMALYVGLKEHQLIINEKNERE